jgi:DNA-binding transcriptional MerR regulator
MSEASRELQRVTAAPVSRPTAWLVGIVGVLIVILGGVATFKSENQAGTVALVVLGSALLFVGYTRRLPLSFEFGGTKVDSSYDEAFRAGEDTGAANALDQLEARVERRVRDDPSVDAAELFLALQDVRQQLAPPVAAESRPPITDPSRITGREIGYRGPVACSAAGITYRQLDYWARTGLVEPSIRVSNSSRRLYSFRDVVYLKIINDMLKTGVSLQSIREMVDSVRQLPEDQFDSAVLVSDGREVRVTDAVTALSDLSESSALLLTNVGRVSLLVRASLGELPYELP